MKLDPATNDATFSLVEPTIVPFIKKWEGFRETEYRCPAGKLTVGYGHVKLPNEELPYILTEEKATELLKGDLRKVHAFLVSDLKGLDINPNLYAAVLSFVFNLGVGAFRDSTLRTVIKNKEFDRVPSELFRWVMAGSKVLLGLQRRRLDEIRLFKPEIFEGI